MTLVPIIQGLIAVTGTLGGTWLGIQLGKRKEERHWRRDRCLDAYAEILTLASQLRDQCEDPTGRIACDPEKAKLLWAKNAELALASKKSALLAPIAVQERIIRLVEFSQQMAVASTRPENHADVVWVKWIVHHQALVNRLMRSARLDLGSPPSPNGALVPFRWHSSPPAPQTPPLRQNWWRGWGNRNASQGPLPSPPVARRWGNRIFGSGASPIPDRTAQWSCLR